MSSDGWVRIVGAVVLVMGLAVTFNVVGIRDRLNRFNDRQRVRQGQSRLGEWWGFGSDDDIALQHGLVRCAGVFAFVMGVLMLWSSWP